MMLSHVITVLLPLPLLALQDQCSWCTLEISSLLVAIQMTQHACRALLLAGSAQQVVGTPS